jgi:hypothetical protein
MGGKKGKTPSISKLVQHLKQMHLADGVYEDYPNVEKGFDK